MPVDEAYTAELLRSKLIALSWPAQESLAQREPEMSQHELDLWREMVWRRSGHYFSDGRLRFLRQRLWERLALNEFSGYSDYYQYVRFNPRGDREFSELLELLLNKETAFFRHPPLFDALTGHVLPPLIAKRRSDNGTITLWSAGCSNGQEAYSMAMAFLDVPQSERCEARIFGTDLSRRSLELARKGRYRSFELRLLPEHFRARYMVRVTMAGEHFYQITSGLREMVQFTQANLFDLESCSIWNVDVIFCQNVLIYFKPEDRNEVAQRLRDRLNPGGYLFLAPAEAVGLRLDGMRPVKFPETVAFQRCG